VRPVFHGRTLTSYSTGEQRWHIGEEHRDLSHAERFRAASCRMTIGRKRCSRDGSFGGFGGGWFVVGGVDDYAAAHAFAVAFGVEVGLVAQG